MTKINRRTNELRGNTLPALTWNWMDVNDVKIDLQNNQKIPYTAVQSVGEIDQELKQTFYDLDHGISEEVMRMNSEQCNLANHWRISDSKPIEVRLPQSAENPLLVDQNQIVVPPLQNGTVLLYNYSEDDSRVERNSTILIDVENDAEANVVLVQRLNENSVSNVSVVARVGDGARLNLATVELGAGNAVFHYMVDMEGFGAESHIKTAYLGSGNDHLDLFYHVRHIGEECISDIQVNGALMDHSVKKFRGTIDFVEGCSGSDGNEEEFTILLDDTVRSIAVPLLLAHEDDIVGNHAASAGQIDEEQLFYLMSRGLSRKESEGLIVESRMTPTFDQIPNEELRLDLRKEVHTRILRR
ncbi:MAG: SufB/SufD family protein [Saccharofermentanales bacterium]|jgi:Fe-S cluster assembly protein SufD